MKRNIKFTGIAFSMMAMTLSLASCVADAPFGSDSEGVLKMRMVINSDVTRSESDIDELRSNCVVYISSEKGLIQKYTGIESIPEEIRLKSGSYVAEAWTGDSVPASWDKKFFRGYQPFEISSGLNQVVLNCRIANVLASVNPTTIDPDLMKDWTIEVSNSRGSLTFDADNMDFAKAYFMMPTDKEASESAGVNAKESVLNYTIAGSNAEGKDFKVTGKIENVKSAHEYIFNIEYHPDYESIGGAFVTVTIDDRETLIEDEVEIFAAPAINGADFEISKQIVGNAGAFNEKIIKVSGFSGLRSIMISTEDNEAFHLPAQNIDLLNITDGALPAVQASGLEWNEVFNADKNLGICYITLTKTMLNALPERDQEYVLNISATDKNGKTSDASVRLAVGEGAIVIEDPVRIPDQIETDLLSIGSHFLSVPIEVVSDETTNPGVRYREAGTSSWTEVPLATVNQVRGSRAHGKIAYVRLTGLKASTRYEIQAISDGFAGESRYMTTEGVFLIPNSSMENWSKFTVADDQMGNQVKVSDKIVLPNAGGTRTFWDTGNHGSATMSKTLTQSSSAMVHSGVYAAELKSQFVGIGTIGKLAAGNLFAGYYYATNGTNGLIKFGRPYDGSHPSALKVWVNYRPGKADSKGGNNNYIPQGSEDKGQIYVALSTKVVEVDTRYEDKLFNPKSDEIVAYGQVTFDGNYGPDGQLAELEIPIEYYEKAKTTRPLYLIIVCTASKYGDFFSGGEGSLMYLDDFELIYE